MIVHEVVEVSRAQRDIVVWIIDDEWRGRDSRSLLADKRTLRFLA